MTHCCKYLHLKSNAESAWYKRACKKLKRKRQTSNKNRQKYESTEHRKTIQITFKTKRRYLSSVKIREINVKTTLTPHFFLLRLQRPSSSPPPAGWDKSTLIRCFREWERCNYLRESDFTVSIKITDTSVLNPATCFRKNIREVHLHSHT